MSSGAALRWVLAPNPSPMTLDGTRTYLVGRTNIVVIDPGPALASHVERVRDAVADAVVSAILVTHHHADHSGAAAALSEVLGVPYRMPAFLGGSGGGGSEGGAPLRAEEVFETDVGTLRTVATPGHSPDHLCITWTEGEAPSGGALFAGDLLMGEGDTTLVAHPEGRLADYLASLDRVEELSPAVIYPAHGPPIIDPPSVLQRYRLHRAERIARVRHALADLPGAQPSELVDAVYGVDLDPRLRAAATRSLEAILVYLNDAD